MSITEKRRLSSGKTCPEYPRVRETSVQCQNCRFNHFEEGKISHQFCMPHSTFEAKAKGAPNFVSEEFCKNWLEVEAPRRKEERKKRIAQGLEEEL